MFALEPIAVVTPIFRVILIPIAERAAPSARFSRGFVPCRLSDDGPGASRTISTGRHPKPITLADIRFIRFRFIANPVLESRNSGIVVGSRPVDKIVRQFALQCFAEGPNESSMGLMSGPGPS